MNEEGFICPDGEYIDDTGMSFYTNKLYSTLNNFSALAIIKAIINLIKIEKIDINSDGHQNQTLAHFFFTTRDLEVISELIKAGADINAEDYWEFTPVYLLFFSESELDPPDIHLPSLELFKLLVSANADFDIIPRDYELSPRAAIAMKAKEGCDNALQLLAYWYVNSTNKEAFELIISEFDNNQEIKQKFDASIEQFMQEYEVPLSANPTNTSFRLA